MGYQARARAPRAFGRRPGKNKPQTKPGKRRTGTEHRFEEEHSATLAEVASRALNSLTRLGDQRFAVAPFHEHYGRWLLNVRNVLSEFEADSTVIIDDEFKEKRSHTLAGIELALNEKRIKEASGHESVRKLNRGLLDARSLLAQTDREYAVKISEIAGKREHAVKPVVTNLGRLREELNRIAHIRAGFLRGISRKAKEEKTTATARRLDTTKEELTRIEKSFATEQEKLKSENELRRRQIVEEIAKYQKEIENIDAGMQADDSLDARHAACEELTNALNVLLQRKQSTLENVGVS
jgi:hypothetical protein